MSFHYRYRKQIIIGVIIVIILSLTTFFIINQNQSSKKKTTSKVETIVKKKKEEKVEETFLQVDIKGEVNFPGIYSLPSDSRIIDVINKAGGLTENANTTVINLSKKIIDEMVIIIYSNAQVEDFSKTKEIESKVIDYCNQLDDNALKNDACIDGSNNISSEKISINNATLNELMTLPGVGESKAKSIIEYRISNGLFTSIEDITKVPGIGDSLFAQIKEYITT